MCVEPEALEGRSLQSANRRPAARLASRASSIPSLLAEGLGFGGGFRFRSFVVEAAGICGA